MSKTADNQNLVAQHVSRSVSTISQLTERTAQDAELTNLCSNDLVKLVNQLNELVSRFQR